jgi:hypothetical protein
MTATEKATVVAKTAKATTSDVPKTIAEPPTEKVPKTSGTGIVKPAKAEAKSAKTTPADSAALKTTKGVKHKLVRDSFTIPKPEYVVIDDLKRRASQAGHPMKKSELIRAGIKALAAMPDSGFQAAIKNVSAIKTGRPKK